MFDDSHPKADALIKMRYDLNNFFAESMKRIGITNLMTNVMKIIAGTLHVGDLSISLRDKKNVVLIAVGKAAIPIC